MSKELYTYHKILIKNALLSYKHFNKDSQKSSKRILFTQNFIRSTFSWFSFLKQQNTKFKIIITVCTNDVCHADCLPVAKVHETHAKTKT